MANKVYDQGVVALSKTETERRLAEALSHANWGASSTLLGELAESTNNFDEYPVIMKETWAAIASTGFNWRVAYKGLALLEFLIRNGNKRVIQEARENISKLRYLLGFSYMKDGTERGMGVREKAKAVLDLLEDDDALKLARREAKLLRQKFKGVGRDEIHSSSSNNNRFHQSATDYDDDEDFGSKPSSNSKKYSDEDDFKPKAKPTSLKVPTKAKKEQDEDDFDFAPSKPAPPSDDDDFDFAPGQVKAAPAPVAKKPMAVAKKQTSVAKDDDDDDFDFAPTTTKKPVTKKAAPPPPPSDNENDDDFGFDDKPTMSAIRPGPIASISVKLPGAKKPSSSILASTSSLAAPPSSAKEVDLMMDAFDPFNAPSKPVAAAVPSSTNMNIMDLFNSPPPQQQSQPSMMMGFQQQQQPPMMMGFQQQPPPMMGFQQPPPMAYQQPPPMAYQQQPPYQQQQPPMAYQQQPMMGFSPQQQQGRPPQQQAKPKPASNDAFSGLMDFSKGGSLI
ncbi:hypothetical protein BASA81_002719 [Batrachochytrium salamandrivorans]|nr:hypothetical protein BASA81_002719 [Batrachochytrium salamandrivorans]